MSVQAISAPSSNFVYRDIKNVVVYNYDDDDKMMKHLLII